MDIQATHAASGKVYKATTIRKPITYVKDGVLMRGSTGNVTIWLEMNATDSLNFSLKGLQTIHVSGLTGNIYIATVDKSALVIDEVQTDNFYLEYAISNISEVITSNVLEIGGLSVTITGNNYGFVDGLSVHRSVSIGASQCIPTSWVAHTSITCVVAAGFTVKTDTIAVVEGKQGLTAVSIFSYDSHNLRIEVPLSATNRGAEGQSITVVGNNFGKLDLSANICVQNSACEMTIWWSDSILACKTDVIRQCLY